MSHPATDGPAHRLEHLALPSASAGTRRQLTVHHFGSGRPRAYLHAALHANEWPGLLVLQHLLERLERAAAAGDVQGQVTVVPFANPVGLAQAVQGDVLGRHDLGDATGNFNRAFPSLAEPVAAALAGRLGPDGTANAAEIRAALRTAVAGLAPRREAEALKSTLLALAIDADFVFDLHCDLEAALHIYAPDAQRALAETLAADLDCAVLLLEDEPGGGAFDQACSGPWRALQQRFAEHPVALGCFSCTVELRGQGDVGDALARADAEGLYRFLQRQGVLGGEAPPVAARHGLTTRLEHVEVVRAPGAGLLVLHRTIGDRLSAGETFGEVVDLERVNHRLPVRAGTDGVLFTHARQHLVRPGQGIAKIAGDRPLESRRPGALLED